MKLIFGILLLVSAALHSQTNNISTSQSFQQYASSVMNSSNDAPRNGSIVQFNPKENTEGSPYLFKNWAKGKVLLKTQQQFNEPSFVLNFDKISGSLVLKISDSKVMQVNMDQIENFKLEDSSGSFSFLPTQDKTDKFYIQLYSDSLYSLYKSIQTKFYRADYVNKGLYESGSKFDRYVDQYTYFIKPNNQAAIAVKNTSKKELSKIGEQIPVAKKYLSDNSVSEDMEGYMINLVIFLNKAATSR